MHYTNFTNGRGYIVVVQCLGNPQPNKVNSWHRLQLSRFLCRLICLRSLVREAVNGHVVTWHAPSHTHVHTHTHTQIHTAQLCYCLSQMYSNFVTLGICLILHFICFHPFYIAFIMCMFTVLRQFPLLNSVRIFSLDSSHSTLHCVLNYVALLKHIFNLTLHYSTHHIFCRKCIF